ncbi:hypothetical protein [Anaeropeptidivorans aminofermentans]|nr:hypothetical protein [Anaeropeptidivorans aminofermentans]
MDTSLAIAIAKAGTLIPKASVKNRKSLPSEYEGRLCLTVSSQTIIAS